MTVFTWTLVEKDGTRKGFIEDTTKSFCMGGFGRDRRYLPPLEPEEEPETPEVKHIYIYDHSNISNRQAARISALENNYSSLKKFINERLDKGKRSYKYNI